MLEAISIKHLTTVSRYCNSGWLSTRLNWGRDEVVALAALCDAKASLEKSANGLGRSPTSIAHRARDTGLILPREWRDAITTYRRRPPRQADTPLQYPFIRKARGEHETLLAVNRLVPAFLPGGLRADACQEIMLAIFMGDVALDELEQAPRLVNEFIKKVKRENYEQGGFAMSLDMPMRDGRSWYDVLPDPTSLT